MKQQFKKIALIAAMSAALGAVSNNAMSAEFFTVNEAVVQPTNAQTFVANLIVGQYGESVTFGLNNTFTTSVVFQATGFTGDQLITSNLRAANGYNLYATLTAGGTYVTDGSSTTFTFTPNSGSGLSVYIDPDQDTTFSAQTSTTKGSLITGGMGNDLLIATGAVTQGGGTLTCTGNGDNCGSFGTKTTFALVGVGSQYFAAPNPFYDMTFSSGDFQGFTPIAGTTQYTKGKLSLDFESKPVPEPESLALFGIGLLGLGMTMRRRKQA